MLDRIVNTDSAYIKKFACREFEPHAKKPIPIEQNTGMWSTLFGEKKVLWYSHGNAWVNLCAASYKSCQPSWIKRNNIYIEIDESKVLHIKTEEDLKSFTTHYGCRIPPELKKTCRHRISIKWDKVAKDWDGIEISQECIENLSKDRIFDWMDRWDCGGGCLWDSSAIKRMIKIEPVRNTTHILKFLGL